MVPRVALVGVSGYGGQHLKVLKRLRQSGQIQFLAATIINRQQEAETWEELGASGVACFETVDAMWSSLIGQIDLCVLPTAPHTHADLSVQAMQHGAHVLVEKPLAPTLDEVERIRLAEKCYQRQVFVGYQDLYNPVNSQIKERLLQKDFGAIKQITFCGLWPRTGRYYGRNEWAGKKVAQGQAVNDSPASNAFAHFMNLALFWAGMEHGKSAAVTRIQAELFRSKSIENFDTCAIRLMTQSGIRILYLVSHSCPHTRVPQLRIETEEGIIEWHHERKAILPKSRNQGAEQILSLAAQLDGISLMYGEVIKALNHSPASVCSIEVATVPVRVVEELSRLEIKDVSSDRLALIDNEGDPLVTIGGIEELFIRCIGQSMLPSEMGVDLSLPINSLVETN